MKRFSFFLGSALLFCLICYSSVSGVPMCGDVNDDGTINIGDPVYLINHIFKGGPAPYPIGKADVNQDGSVNIGDAVWLIVYVFLGDFPPVCLPYATTVTDTECKSEIADDPATDQDCINWSYDGEATLSIEHLNAGFNCCPIEFFFDVDLSNGIITVTESEEDMGCDCMCLFDVAYDIYEIPPGQYTIIFYEPYVGPGNDLLMGAIDLTAAGSGNFCVTRTFYPWHTPESGSGVIGWGECQGSPYDKDPDSARCVAWEYNENTGVLLLTHENSVANCCVDSIYATISYDGISTYMITELQALQFGSGCSCLCYYDVAIRMENIEPRLYHFSLLCPECNESERINVDIDFSQEPTGRFCPE
ncbi:MAG: dockerin type I repeat-containing protein [Candidatus Zixiibacteriota bacterium]